MESNKNIFIHAISQRCGHNYLTKLIQSQTKHKVLIHQTHEVIFPEIIAERMEELVNNNRFVRNKKAKIKEIQTASNTYINQRKPIIFKTSKLTSKYEIDLFPDVKHIILIRDPRDLFVSYEKSIYNFRVKTFKNKIKKLLRPIYSYYVLIKWSKMVERAIAAYKTSQSNYIVLKYEELSTIKGQQKLFDYLKYPYCLEELIHIKNTNSSFAEDSKRWKTHSINIGDPSKRYQNSNPWLKWMIDKTLKKTVNNLNYKLS